MACSPRFVIVRRDHASVPREREPSSLEAGSAAADDFLGRHLPCQPKRHMMISVALTEKS
jgi:hypothetical protein